MKEIEEMSSDDDDFATGGAHDEDGDDGGEANTRKKRAAQADLRGSKGGKKMSGRGAGSTFASADDVGAQVDSWHAQLIQVRALSPDVPPCSSLSKRLKHLTDILARRIGRRRR